jgi:hypothetical protein
MFEAGKCLLNWSQAAGNITPRRGVGTTVLVRRLSRSHALRLAIELAIELAMEQCQIVKFLPAGRTGGKMRMHVRRIQQGFRSLPRFLEQLRQFRRSDMLVGISFQS